MHEHLVKFDFFKHLTIQKFMQKCLTLNQSAKGPYRYVGKNLPDTIADASSEEVSAEVEGGREESILGRKGSTLSRDGR